MKYYVCLTELVQCQSEEDGGDGVATDWMCTLILSEIQALERRVFRGCEQPDMEYNFVMRYTVDQLNRELRGVRISIIYCDVFESSMNILKNHQLYGFSETTKDCCGLGTYKGWLPCISPEMACSNAASHLW
ncbi:unnamed protein product [Eruca vesicaria subsp. sativa]|uniref:Uncharacterized protein n=1 Tax=Eruca vesicaria subsp. sativa TaxID=29727 RepID=A0ABC8LXL4_ERUVS|nr:unnamed protein product [Eruca vesicaria subsp. sativa]